VESAIQPATPPPTDPEDSGKGSSSSSSKAKKLLSLFKGTTRTGVNTALHTDLPRAKLLGSKPAQNRLGVVAPPDQPPSAGPSSFPCRFHGKTGMLHIVTSAPSPCISFCFEKHVKEAEPEFAIALPMIRELKKVGGLGWKSKLVVGWSMDRNVVDGIQIVDTQGNEWLLTAVEMRDELFNRLIAMGGQKWESW
jgi:hypothetical protein